jgi:hypothetical protein
LQVRNILQGPKGITFLQALLDVLQRAATPGAITQVFVRFAERKASASWDRRYDESGAFWSCGHSWPEVMVLLGNHHCGD